MKWLEVTSKNSTNVNGEFKEDTTSANAGIVGIPIGSHIIPKDPKRYRRIRPKWIDELLASVGAGWSATS